MVSTLPTPPTKPHWRRTETVFAILDSAPSMATYDQLIELVRKKTGKGCSRKLISRWKRERAVGERATVVVTENASPIEGRLVSLATVESELPSETVILSLLEPDRPDGNRRGSLLVRYLTSTAAAILALTGCSYLPAVTRKPATLNVEPVAVQPSPVPKKTPSLQPREIKIQLTLTSPGDLKVKPQERIVPGQVLSDRATERQRLQAQRQQLELSLKQLEIPLPELTLPSPPPALKKLPPVAYRQEIANINLKTRELRQIETTIERHRRKIQQLQALLPKPAEVQIASSVPTLPAPTFVTLDSKPVPPTENSPVATIIEHERAKLSQLEDEREKARIQLDIARSQLSSAREKRLHEEYQLSLEENRRAIAIQNQRIEVEKQGAIRAGQLQEREYSKAQIRARIQEIENALVQLGTVKAPYAGTVKRVKWKGQSDRTLLVELTLDVDESVTRRASPLP